MTEQPPPWPSRIEAVEIAKLDLKPGDTLIVKAREGNGFSVHVSEEIRDYFQAFFPDVEVMVTGLPVDLEVRPATKDGP